MKNYGMSEITHRGMVNALCLTILYFPTGLTSTSLKSPFAVSMFMCNAERAVRRYLKIARKLVAAAGVGDFPIAV